MKWNAAVHSTIRLPVFICWHFYGLAQDCSNSSALAMELLQSCTKPFVLSVCYLLVCIGEIVIHSNGCPIIVSCIHYISCTNPSICALNRPETNRLIDFSTSHPFIKFYPRVTAPWGTNFNEIWRKKHIKVNIVCILMAILFWQYNCPYIPPAAWSMAWCKRDVTPVLMHWSYISFA